jgi:hypothetical protein
LLNAVGGVGGQGSPNLNDQNKNINIHQKKHIDKRIFDLKNLSQH